jgi:hypothetical protein
MKSPRVQQERSPALMEVSETTYPDDVADLKGWYRRYRVPAVIAREMFQPSLLFHIYGFSLIRVLALGFALSRGVMNRGGDPARYRAFE